MATPIEDIKQGVLLGDWKKVVRGLNKLTGDKLKPPAQEKLAEVKRSDVPLGLQAELKTEALKQFAEDVIDLIRERVHLGYNTKEAEEIAQELEDDDSEEEVYDHTDPPAQNSLSIPTQEAKRTDFYIDHAANRTTAQTEGEGEGETGGKRPCRVEPFKPGMVNNFKDDRKLDKKLIEADKKLSGKIKPTERRPPKSQKKVRVTCWKCHRDYTVDEDEAPATIGGERSSYTCVNCVGGTRGR